MELKDVMEILPKVSDMFYEMYLKASPDDATKLYEYFDAVDEAFKYLDRQAIEIMQLREPKWISVNERLPDFEKPCFVTYYYQDIYAGEGYAVYEGFVFLSDEGIWIDRNGDEFFEEITHWRYANIPEPPKEG